MTVTKNDQTGQLFNIEKFDSCFDHKIDIVAPI